MTDDHQLHVSETQDGTIINHVTVGQALNVLVIPSIDDTNGEAVSVGMSVPSDRLGRKDIVKVEGRELSQSEMDVLSSIAPVASTDIVRGYDVIEKNRVVRPGAVTSIVSCSDRDYVLDADEPT